MIDRQTKMGPTSRRGFWGALLPLGMILLLGACDSLDQLLSVDVPSDVEADELREPGSAPLLVLSAITDFECALVHYIVAGGKVGDEFEDSQLAAALGGYDRRDFNLPPLTGAFATTTCAGAIGVYTPLSTARFQADDALHLLEEVWAEADVPDRSDLIAQAAAFSGYSHILLGEAMCTVAFDEGPELPRSGAWERAEDRFTRAIAAAEAAGNDDMLNLSLVGRARARLNLGDGPGAVSDASLVPEGFAHYATYTAGISRRENRVFTRNEEGGLITIGRWYRDLTVDGVPDPRVPVTDSGRMGADIVTPLFVQSKYTSRSSPIPIGRWEEAQLIIAEVEGGQTAVDIINDLRGRHDLPPFSSTDAAEIQEQIIEERARELFLEGHHLGDIIRYDLPLRPPAGTPYPPKMGGAYGDMTCFPLPDVERLNNPNIS